MEFLAATTAAIAVFLAVVTAVQSRRPARAIEERLGQIERVTPAEREELLAQPFTARVASPLARKFGTIGGGMLPARIHAAAERRLIQAGRPMTTSAYLMLVGITVVGALLLVIVGLASGNAPRVMMGQVVGAAIVPLIPIYWLRIKVGARKRALVRALPDAVDLMVTTVEAGLGIDGALAEVGQETPGPLGDELRTAVRETTLGRSRREALLRLIERTEVQELRSFIQAIVQAEQTGIPIGQVLRIQADQMRLRRRQLAEAEAQRAPVKMILVMIILVLPAMLLFVMGPAYMRMREIM